MKHFPLIVLLVVVAVGARATPQEARPPLSKDEVVDLLTSSTPSKVIIATIKQAGIAFQPTPEVLEELRKAGANPAVLAALREAWHPEVPKPLGDRQILILLAGEAPSQNIARMVLERGIDFQPTGEYLQELRGQGAEDILINTLRTAAPRPFSKDELLQQLRSHLDQEVMAWKVRERAIDFEANAANLQALRNAGATPTLLDAVRAAKRVKPFVVQAPSRLCTGAYAQPSGGAQAGDSHLRGH